MSWSKTYTHTLAIAADMLGSAIVWNKPDVCISSLCCIVRYRDRGNAYQKLRARQHLRKFAPWQISALRAIGNALEWLDKGHCEASRRADLSRLATAQDFLE